MSANPTVTKDKVVTVKFSLRDSAGQLLHETPDDDPLVYLHGAGTILPGLEEGLEGRPTGESFELTVPPEKAFGPSDPTKVEHVDRGAFPADVELEVGMPFSASDGNEETTIWVTAIEGDQVTVNGNHPLAGETLSWTGEVLEIRDAKPEELEHGHAHGPGGHAH